MYSFFISGIAIFTIALILWWNSYVTAQQDEPLRKGEHRHGHFFYANRDDARIYLPKRGGEGYTLNFGNPLSYLLIFLGLIVVVTFIM